MFGVRLKGHSTTFRMSEHFLTSRLNKEWILQWKCMSGMQIPAVRNDFDI
uniref:Uncharacterized protein n=1 Tax=Anguilla anguilla TaxID=7936 RepID=A0A0E9SX45_ANGAN